MPIINPDLTNVAPIPPGTYKAKIIAVDVRDSKKGNPMIVPKFEIDVRGKTREKEAYIVITGKGAAPFGQLLRACGFAELANAYLDMDNPVKPDFDTDQLIGQTLNLVVEADTFNDAPSDSIVGYLKS